MKLAIFSESPADELSVRILVEGILGQPIELVEISVQRPPGSSGIASLRDVVSHLYYHTDADALVVVIDSDDTPVHEPSHDSPGGEDSLCRVCAIRATITTSIRRIRPKPGRTLRYAVGSPVPAIEAWCLSGTKVHVTEAAWLRFQQTNQRPGFDRRSLKRDLYGTERPDRELETRMMSEAMRRVVSDLPGLEQRFPNGFGALLRAVRDW